MFHLQWSSARLVYREGTVHEAGREGHAMRMKVQTAYGAYTRTHEALVEFDRIEMLARGIVDANAVIRSSAKTCNRTCISHYFQVVENYSRDAKMFR